jgi:hypothetical protein
MAAFLFVPSAARAVVEATSALKIEEKYTKRENQEKDSLV